MKKVTNDMVLFQIIIHLKRLQMIIGEKQSIIEDQVTQDIDNIKNEILSYI